MDSGVDRFVSPKDPWKLSGIGDKASVLLIWAPGDLPVFELPFRSSDQNTLRYNHEHHQKAVKT